MATLADMKLDKKKQISYRSTDEIVANLDLAAARLASVKVSFGGGKLRTGHLVNAIALWVGEMPTEELVRFAKPKLAALESYLGRLDDDADDDDLIGALPEHPIPVRPPREVKAHSQDLPVVGKTRRPAGKK
jgi:hypothetical protein